MFKVLDEVCKPTKGSKYSAGIDLYARTDVVIGAGETVKVPLGVKIDTDALKAISDRDLENLTGLPINEIENGDGDADLVYFDGFKSSHHLELFNRSSTALKRGLMLANGTGIIDLDFPDEICALLHNPIDLDFVEAISCQEVVVSMTGDNRETPHCGNSEIKKGDKICQIILKENKTYLMGIESDEERSGGFGSSGS